MRCLVVAVRWLCTNFIYTHFFFSAADFSCCPFVIQLSKLFKKKKSNRSKKECLDFSTFTFNRLFTATDVRHQISHKASYKNIFWPALPAPTAPGGQRTLQKAPHKPRPAQVSHTLKVHLSEIFPKDGSCCFYVAFLQAALTSVLLFVHAVVSIIRFVAVTRWRMYKGRWGGGALWLTPETCFWPGRKWRPLACRCGSWDVAVVFFFFFCKCHMIIRWPRLGEDLDPADRLRDDRRKRPSGLSKPASFWESESRTSLPVWARNIVRTQTLQVLQHGATRVWLQLS